MPSAPETYYVQALAFSGDTTYHLAMSEAPRHRAGRAQQSHRIAAQRLADQAHLERQRRQQQQLHR